MKYDFDSIIERRGTYSIKYDMQSMGIAEDVLPFWVADMDFKTPPCVVDALIAKSSHGIFGYSDTDSEYYEVLENWFKRRFGWNIKQDWLIKTPGIVTALYIAVRAFTKPGESVIIQQPVYHPFADAIEATGRKLVINQLLYNDNRYSIDFDDFEAKIQDNNVKLFILCNPHNPVGRVWSEGELLKLGEICLRQGVLVISDEIHQDFIYTGHKHLVFSNLAPEFKEITITCTAPSKTFNLAGLQISNLFIPNPDLRNAFNNWYVKFGLSQPSLMGIVACKAAYSEGEEWLTQLISYLEDNISFMNSYINEKAPQIKMVEPEGTYLTWLDFKELGLTDAELRGVVLNKAKLWLNQGSIFGSGGEGFFRMNIACPRQILREGLDRLYSVI